MSVNTGDKKVIYQKLAKTVVDYQKQIIGPIAILQAKSITGIKITGEEDVLFTGSDPKKTLELLVRSYADLFGKASIELSKEAVAKVHAPKNILPRILKD